MKELKKCILNGPYVMTRVLVLAKSTTETDPPVPEHTVQETYENTLRVNHAYIDAEAEAIHMIFSGIGDEIYFTVDACKTAQEIWITIERLQQGESLNKHDVKTNLFWEFGKFTLRDGESIESYYSRFYKMINEMIRNKLEVANMQVNYPNDNYYHAPKPHKNHTTSSRHTSSTSCHAPTKNKGKEVAKPITPPSPSVFEDDSDPEQAQRDKDMPESIALISKYFTKIYKPTNNNLRTSSNSRNKNVDYTPRTKNDRQIEQFGNQMTVTVAGARKTIGKPKRVKDYSYHKEKMMLCKHEEKYVPLSAEQSDWLQDTDEEPDEKELEAHYIQLSEQPESINDTYVIETVDSNAIPDHSDICNNEFDDDQNADDNDEYERVELYDNW
ncbi:hypothetical protein Tco_0861886 [Tanacetum coccineum]